MKPDDWRRHLTTRKRDDLYEHLLAGGAKVRLLESFVDLNLAALLWDTPQSAVEIARKLALQPFRTRKWLNLLGLLGLLNKEVVRHGAAIVDEIYSLTSFSRSLFKEKNYLHPYHRSKIAYWKQADSFDICEVLKWKALPHKVKWPPQTMAEAKAYTDWMKLTTDILVDTLKKSVDFNLYPNLLHVAGGDYATTIRLAELYPNTPVTVFSQPLFAYLARKEVEKTGKRISVLEGDLEGDDSLPDGFAAILWTRAFSDFQEEAVLNLLKKTRKCVDDNGKLIICEIMTDGNESFVLTCEFNYLFADDLKAGLFKSRKKYEDLLAEAGFKVADFQENVNEGMYSVIIAVPV